MPEFGGELSTRDGYLNCAFCDNDNVISVAMLPEEKLPFIQDAVKAKITYSNDAMIGDDTFLSGTTKG
jgi:hypothetical protein